MTPAEIIAEALRLAQGGADDAAWEVASRLPAGTRTLAAEAMEENKP